MKRNAKLEHVALDVSHQLRRAGVSVATIAAPGTAAELTGMPTLLIGHERATWLMWIALDGRLTKQQREWSLKWRGGEGLVIKSTDEALAALGLMHPDSANEAEPTRAPCAGRPTIAT